jgi:uncharacterized protein YndB with AHSA1/START domain
MSTQPAATARVTTQLPAAPERVFAAWVEPAVLERWIFARSADEQPVRFASDAKVGGVFSFVVRRGGGEMDHFGTYLEVDRPRRLAFTWAARPVGDAKEPDLSRVIIDIRGAGSASELILAHELHPKWADFAPRAEASWRRMTDRLAAALAQP